jgi:hypothetical protein
MAAINGLRLLASCKQPQGPAPAAPVAVEASDEDQLPIPSDIKTALLGGLFLMGVLAACYVTPDNVLPILLAVVNLVLQRDTSHNSRGAGGDLYRSC